MHVERNSVTSDTDYSVTSDTNNSVTSDRITGILSYNSVQTSATITATNSDGSSRRSEHSSELELSQQCAGSPSMSQVQAAIDAHSAGGVQIHFATNKKTNQIRTTQNTTQNQNIIRLCKKQLK